MTEPGGLKAKHHKNTALTFRSPDTIERMIQEKNWKDYTTAELLALRPHPENTNDYINEFGKDIFTRFIDRLYEELKTRPHVRTKKEAKLERQSKQRAKRFR